VLILWTLILYLKIPKISSLRCHKCLSSFLGKRVLCRFRIQLKSSPSLGLNFCTSYQPVFIISAPLLEQCFYPLHHTNSRRTSFKFVYSFAKTTIFFKKTYQNECLCYCFLLRRLDPRARCKEFSWCSKKCVCEVKKARERRVSPYQHGALGARAKINRIKGVAF
jgi:hypothetical protein